MKCPKCAYVSHDYLDACRKCSKDLVAFKRQFHLEVLEPIEVIDLSVLVSAGGQGLSDAGSFRVENDVFVSQMRVEPKVIHKGVGEEFDIKLDDSSSDMAAAQASMGEPHGVGVGLDNSVAEAEADFKLADGTPDASTEAPRAPGQLTKMFYVPEGLTKAFATEPPPDDEPDPVNMTGETEIDLEFVDDTPDASTEAPRAPGQLTKMFYVPEELDESSATELLPDDDLALIDMTKGTEIDLEFVDDGPDASTEAPHPPEEHTEAFYISEEFTESVNTEPSGMELPPDDGPALIDMTEGTEIDLRFVDDAPDTSTQEPDTSEAYTKVLNASEELAESSGMEPSPDGEPALIDMTEGTEIDLRFVDDAPDTSTQEPDTSEARTKVFYVSEERAESSATEPPPDDEPKSMTDTESSAEHAELPVDTIDMSHLEEEDFDDNFDEFEDVELDTSELDRDIDSEFDPSPAVETGAASDDSGSEEESTDIAPESSRTSVSDQTVQPMLSEAEEEPRKTETLSDDSVEDEMVLELEETNDVPSGSDAHPARTEAAGLSD